MNIHGIHLSVASIDCCMQRCTLNRVKQVRNAGRRAFRAACSSVRCSTLTRVSKCMEFLSIMQADVPFEQLAAARAGAPSQGGARGDTLGGGGPNHKHRKRKQTLQHRENKNRPAETSSRRPIGRLRDVLQAPKM